MPVSHGAARTLSRDYKSVRRHTHVAAGHAVNAWAAFGAGLTLGLLVALGVFLHYRGPAQVAAEPVPAPAQAPASAVASDESIVAATETAPQAPELDFYDLLPKQEVDVAADGDSTAPRTPLPTGDVILQAGSFKLSTEAEKMVAQLALVGVDGKIQRASVDDETWYRVRIGPISTADELHVVQSKLREAEITATAVTPIEEAALP